MKKNVQRSLVTFLIAFLVFFGAFRTTEGAPPGPPASGKTEWGQISNLSPLPDEGYLEDITFERGGGRERVTLMVSRQPVISIGEQVAGAVLIKLENMLVPEELRRPLGEGKFTNITAVSPTQEAFEGKQWVYLTIALKERVPYSIRQEGQKILIDFNVISLAEKITPGVEKPVYEERGKEKTPTVDLQKTELVKAPFPAAKEVKSPTVLTGEEKETPAYTGRRISLDFQDANIKSVFRLLSELGGVSIVSSDEVKGKVTCHMENVPWDQALDTILTIQGLSKRQEGSVITVIPLERMRKEEAEQKALAEAQRKAEEVAAEAEQKFLAEKGKLRQISIEAKIVQVTTDFSRSLGIQWGYGYRDVWRGRDYGVLVGTGGLSSASSQSTVTSLPNNIGLTGSNLAVNFPSDTIAAGPAIGAILGSSKFVLDAKLEALESSGEGKIISSPKVTTLEGIEATIWQGVEVPVVTPATTSAPATVTYKDAKLELKVTPKITPDNERISTEVNAVDKNLDWSKTVEGNPAINSSGVKSNIVVKDGETFVVGGIYKEVESNTVRGVPGLSKIPVLGWLFKYEVKAKTKREILIFITPRIIKAAMAEGAKK